MIIYNLPEATKEPCNDCPWRRIALAGWLGPYTIADWLALVHSDEPIACHKSLKEESWNGALQCSGAAIYRKNVGKLPRDSDVAVAGLADKKNVFATRMEFMKYHSKEK
mgnify:CR=1 FL=1